MNKITEAQSAPKLVAFGESTPFLPKPCKVRQVANASFSEKMGDAYFKVKDKIFSPSPAGKKLRELSENPSLFSDSNYADTLKAAFLSDEFNKSLHFIEKIMKRLPYQDLNTTLKALFDAHVGKNPKDLIKRLKTLLTLQKLEQIINSDENVRFTSLRDELKNHGKTVKRSYREKDELKASTFRKTIQLYILNTLDYIINIVMYVFNLKQSDLDEGDTENAQNQAMMKYYMFRENMMMIREWLTTISLLAGSLVLTGSITVGIIGLSIAAAAAYTKWIKPCPEYLPPFKNMVSEAMKGELTPVYGREQELEEIIKILCSNNSSVRQHVLLVGPSGVGKSEIVSALAQKIASGNVPDQLKGKKLFSVNTADLVKNSKQGSIKVFEKALHAMKGFEGDAIFFFDEIHCAFDNEESKQLSQKLKTVFDNKPNSLKYCIGATTSKEFKQYVEKEEAIMRRVHKIDVESMDSDQTLATLRKTAQKEYPDIIVTDKALKIAAEIKKENDFSEVAQPFFPKKILSTALTTVRQAPPTENAKKLKEEIERRDQAETAYHLLSGVDKYSDQGALLRKQLLELKKSIKDLEKLVEGEKTEIEQFHKLVQSLNELKEACDLEAIKLSKKGTHPSDEKVMDFMFDHFYRQEAIKRSIEAKLEVFEKKYPNVPFKVDEALISKLKESYRQELVKAKAEKSAASASMTATSPTKP